MTLPAHGARLGELRRDLRALATREGEYRSAHPVRFLHEQDMRAGRYVVRAGIVDPVPSAIAENVGALLRELRAILDDAASQVAGMAVRFPIHDSLPMFAQRARKAITNMPDTAQAEIESLQPYHAIGGYRNGPLWMLDQLAGQPVARLAPGALRDGAELGVNTRRKVELLGEPEITTGAFEGGAVVALQQFRIVGPDPKLDMYFRGDLTLAFAADGAGRGREVVELLGALADHVERTALRLVERSLPSG